MTHRLGAGLFFGVAILYIGSRLAAPPQDPDRTLDLLQERLSRLEAAKPPPSQEAIRQAILLPSVAVRGSGGSGSGTVIASYRENAGSYATYILTAAHLISTADPALRAASTTADVRFYDGAGLPAERGSATALAADPTRDIAILRLTLPRAWSSARLARGDGFREISVLTPVYAVGCPLGHDPIPTLGEISTLSKIVDGERCWMMTAPTTYGNSGGGVFRRDTLELIGVSSRVCTFDAPEAVPVPHLSVLLPLDAIHTWLAAHGQGRLIPFPASRKHEW